jgi:hypothetical protein
MYRDNSFDSSLSASKWIMLVPERHQELLEGLINSNLSGYRTRSPSKTDVLKRKWRRLAILGGVSVRRKLLPKSAGVALVKIHLISALVVCMELEMTLGVGSFQGLGTGGRSA